MKRLLRTIAVILSAVMLICAVSCKGPEADTTAAEDTTTEAEQTVTDEVTQPPETDTLPADTGEDAEKTEPVSGIQTWTFDDGKQYVIGIFCRTEPDALVYVCKRDGEVLIKEHALDKFFYGMYILPAGLSGQTV